MTQQTAPPYPGHLTKSASSEVRDESIGAGGRKKVALFEDGLPFCQTVKDFLEESGYEVVIGQSGPAGTNEVIGANCDVILCDMMMPSGSGETLFRSIERLRPELCERFVFMTANRGNSRINDFLAQVRGTVLMKPFAMGDLLEVIAFVQIRSALRALT